MKYGVFLHTKNNKINNIPILCGVIPHYWGVITPHYWGLLSVSKKGTLMNNVLRSTFTLITLLTISSCSMYQKYSPKYNVGYLPKTIGYKEYNLKYYVDYKDSRAKALWERAAVELCPLGYTSKNIDTSSISNPFLSSHYYIGDISCNLSKEQQEMRELINAKKMIDKSIAEEKALDKEYKETIRREKMQKNLARMSEETRSKVILVGSRICTAKLNSPVNGLSSYTEDYQNGKIKLKMGNSYIWDWPKNWYLCETK